MNDWKRVGEFAAARRRQLGLTQPEIHQRGGPSAALVRQVEKGAYSASMQATVKRGYEVALRWAPHSIDELLSGGEPTPLSEDDGWPSPSQIRPDRDGIVSVYVSAERDADGVVSVSAVSEGVSDADSTESRMELRYWPGAGRTVSASELAPIVGNAHRAALRATEPDQQSRREGGDGDGDSPPTSERTYPPLIGRAAREDD